MTRHAESEVIRITIDSSESFRAHLQYSKSYKLLATLKELQSSTWQRAQRLGRSGPHFKLQESAVTAGRGFRLCSWRITPVRNTQICEMKNDTSACSSLLKDALERILQACGSEWLHQRELSELKSACQTALASLKSEATGPPIEDANRATTSVTDSSDADYANIVENDRLVCAHFTPFKIALESKISSVVIISLESLHRFLVHGYMRGNFPCPKHPKSLHVVDALVQGASSCVGTNSQDPKVSLDDFFSA